MGRVSGSACRCRAGDWRALVSCWVRGRRSFSWFSSTRSAEELSVPSVDCSVFSLHLVAAWCHAAFDDGPFPGLAATGLVYWLDPHVITDVQRFERAASCESLSGHGFLRLQLLLLSLILLRLKESAHCRDGCSGPAAHQTLCRAGIHPFLRSVSQVEQSQVRVFSHALLLLFIIRLTTLTAASAAPLLLLLPGLDGS